MTNPHSTPNDLNPRADLIGFFSTPALLGRWGHATGASSRTVIPGVAVVEESIALCRAALAQLGDRKSERADAARAWLTSTRERCSGALEALSEVALPGFPGGSFDGLVAQYSERLAVVANAERALARSTTANVKQSRENLDFSQAQLREFTQGTLEDLKVRMTWPAPPPASVFAAAESTTQDLVRVSKGSAPIALETALRFGRESTREEALLWVCFEPQKDPNDLFSWRAKMHAESGGAG